MTAAGGTSRIRVLALPAYNRSKQNPFTALLYKQVEKLNVEVEEWTFWRAFWRSCDLWHLHHPDTVVFPRRRWQSAGETLALRLLLTLAWLRGIRVLWTIHDLRSHDGLHPAIENWFWRYFPPRVDAFVSLTETGRDLARAQWPALASKPAFVAPHGHFRDIYPNEIGKEQARSILDIAQDRTVILHYGLIRPYKSVPNLINAFRQLSPAGATLLIAGKVWDPELETEIRALTGEDDNIDLRLQWVPFDKTQLYFNACDLVVLPYRQILNSGAALLALGFDRPVLVPRIGAMPELEATFGPTWVRMFDGAIEPDDLADAIAWSSEPRDAGVNWDGLDWQTIARKHREVYDLVLDNHQNVARANVASAAGEA